MSSLRVAVAAIQCPNCYKLALFEGHQTATLGRTNFRYLNAFHFIEFLRIYHYPEEWIGLRKSDSDEEGFYWVDGTAVDHTNWQGGQPENATDSEECVIDATEYYGNGWKVGRG